MNTTPHEQAKTEKRRCDRFNLNRTVKVTFTDQRTLEGSTVNISLGGVLIKTAQHNDEMLLGQTAQMSLLSNEGNASDAYACKVVRVTSNLIGLAVDNIASAALGKELTRRILNRR